MSPIMIKALFSALGITPEQIIEPITQAVKDIAEFKASIKRIEERLYYIENYITKDYTPAENQSIMIEGNLHDEECADRNIAA